jgi:hypothetical protein
MIKFPVTFSIEEDTFIIEQSAKNLMYQLIIKIKVYDERKSFKVLIK